MATVIFRVRSNRIKDIELDEGRTIGELRDILFQAGYDVKEADIVVTRAKEQDKLVGEIDSYVLKQDDMIEFLTDTVDVESLFARTAKLKDAEQAAKEQAEKEKAEQEKAAKEKATKEQSGSTQKDKDNQSDEDRLADVMDSATKFFDNMSKWLDDEAADKETKKSAPRDDEKTPFPYDCSICAWRTVCGSDRKVKSHSSSCKSCNKGGTKVTLDEFLRAFYKTLE